MKLVGEQLAQWAKREADFSRKDLFGQRIREGVGWEELFPGVASLNLSTTGTGINVDIRITKKEGEAASPEKRVNESAG